MLIFEDDLLLMEEGFFYEGKEIKRVKTIFSYSHYFDDTCSYLFIFNPTNRENK